MRLSHVGRWTLGVWTCFVLAGVAAHAGTVDLEWDAVPSATGYRVYYGLVSGTYTQVKDVGNRTSTTMGSLTDCTNYYMAVKAYNAFGESDEFSNEVWGWARPSLTGPAPVVMQGHQMTVNLQGANFKPGAVVEIDNPRVFVASVAVPSCTALQFVATVDPLSPGLRAAEIGSFEVTVQNPTDVFGKKSNAFTVRINPERFDVNRTDAKTIGRLDGKDTVWLSRTFGARDGDALYAPDHDFTGDGWIDGEDLAHLASNLGRCWTGTTWGNCGNGGGN
jgi:hypothetical protein